MARGVRTKKEQLEFEKRLLDRFAILITTAFGLVAALAWNDAVRHILAVFEFEKTGPIFYAIIITIIAVFATVYINRVVERVDSKATKKRK